MQKLVQLLAIVIASLIGFGCNGVVPKKPLANKDMEFLFPTYVERQAEFNRVSYSADSPRETSNLRQSMLAKMEEKAFEAPGKMRDARARFLYTYFPWALSDAQLVQFESEDLLREILQYEHLVSLRETIEVYGHTPTTEPIARQAGQRAMDSYYDTIAERLHNCEDPDRTLALIQELENASWIRKLAYLTPEQKSLDSDQTAALTLP